MRGERHSLASKAFASVDHALGLDASQHNVIGAWADGAENSTMTVIKGGDWETARVAAAMKGYLAAQKQVLIFQHGAEGNAFMASFFMPGTLEGAHGDLLSKGLEFHTLEPVSGGFMVHVYGEDDEVLRKVNDIAEGYGEKPKVRGGRGEFIGSQKQDGEDGAIRKDARKVYEDDLIAAAKHEVEWTGETYRKALQLGRTLELPSAQMLRTIVTARPFQGRTHA